MTNRARALVVAGIMALPFLARAAQQQFRTPGGQVEPLTNYALLAVLCAAVVAVTEAPPRTSSLSKVFVASGSAALAVLGAAATSQVFFPTSLPRFVILLTALLVFAWLSVVGTVHAVRLRRSGGGERVLAIVGNDDAAHLRADVSDGPFEQRFTLVEAMPLDDARVAHDLVEWCAAERVSTVVLGPEATVRPDIVDQADILHGRGTRVRSLDDFYDESLGKLPLSALDRFALMGDVESIHGGYAPLKRAIDLALATVGALALVLVLPFVLFGNLIANRGPLFFRQERVGRGGRPFRIWKLRTMTPGADDVSGWTSNEDPRITTFGKLLRRTHLDELPQVFNIFVGELAVVGPRPEQVTYARQLESKLPFYAARHLVRPGLTGWAQVKYRYGASEEDAFVKLQYDLHYVRHESLATDLRIIWLTFRHIVRDGGR